MIESPAFEKLRLTASADSYHQAGQALLHHCRIDPPEQGATAPESAPMSPQEVAEMVASVAGDHHGIGETVAGWFGRGK